MWQRRKDGEEFLCWIELTEVRDALGARTHFVGVVNDITDSKRAEQELRYLANYDTLTGLPNRSAARRAPRPRDRARAPAGNAGRGAVPRPRPLQARQRFDGPRRRRPHAEGGGRAPAARRARERHGRAPGRRRIHRRGRGRQPARSTAERMAQKIIAAFAEPLEIDGAHEVVISPSIGISLYPDHGQVPTDLLKFADTAMYQAKERGRNTYQIYTEAMDAEARLRATMVAALRKALERNEFRLVYQPQIVAARRPHHRRRGAAALAQRELGRVPPTVFIPLAEETGLILAIGEWVLREACAQLQRWRAAGLRDIDDVGQRVGAAAAARRPAATCSARHARRASTSPAEPLELEVDRKHGDGERRADRSRRCAQLKALGVTLAIDDFGTGYSSLSLPEAPADRHAQDRQGIRRRHHHRSGRRGDHRDRHHDGAFARPERRRRGRRDRGAARVPARAGLRRDPGPLAVAAARRAPLPAHFIRSHRTAATLHRSATPRRGVVLTAP